MAAIVIPPPRLLLRCILFYGAYKNLLVQLHFDIHFPFFLNSSIFMNSTIIFNFPSAAPL